MNAQDSSRMVRVSIEVRGYPEGDVYVKVEAYGGPSDGAKTEYVKLLPHPAMVLLDAIREQVFT